MLHLDRVGRRYGGLDALAELTLTVPAGARHAVIGANGAGKSTLLHLIAGSVRPTTGQIRFDGRDITRRGPAARARLGIGRTFQHPAVFTRLPVVANVSLALSRRPRAAPGRTAPPRAGRMAEARAILAAAGLAAHADVAAGQLPYGLRRLLELTLTLAARPRLLLLDEPSAGLETTEIRRLGAAIRALPGDTTVILVDHNLDLVWDIADTITVLDHGRHLATGTPAQIRTDPDVQAAYLTTPTSPPAVPSRPRPVRQPAALLRVRALRAGYHGAPVLDGLNLDVDDGEVLAILGRNGAGKSTLLNTLAGLHTPAPTTTITLAGHPLAHGQPTAISRAAVALVPQGRRLFHLLTVAEHLTAATATRARAGHGRAWTRDDVLDLLPALRARLAHHAGTLSGGEQQMLALARALLARPRLLLLDEPTEGLAPRLVDQLADTLDTIAATGQVTVLLAEQNVPLALRLAHRVIVLDHGRLAHTATPDNLRTGPLLDTLLGVLPAGPAA